MSPLEEARSSLTKYSRSKYAKRKRSSKHRSESVNSFLSGQLLKKRKRKSSERDQLCVKEALVKSDKLKRGKVAVQKLIVSIPLDTGVRVNQHCHKELSHGSSSKLDSEAIDIIDITGSSDESPVGEVLNNRSDAVMSSGMNGFCTEYGLSKSGANVNGHSPTICRDLPSAQYDSSCNHDRPQLVSVEHRLSCLKHDHPYSKLPRRKTLPSILPSILTPPPSAEPCEELSFSTHTTDVTISPPLTPVDDSQPGSQISRYFELNSPQPNDYPQSNSPIPLSPVSTAFKLQWSSASSACSDFETCARDNEVSPLTTKPRQETKNPSRRLHFRGRKPYKPSHMSLNSGWRKGPVPLPRSFSKRHSSASLLQTKAAKQKSVKSVRNVPYQPNDLDGKSYHSDSEVKIKTKKFSLSLKRRGFERIKNKKLMKALAPFIANDENHFDQIFPSEDLNSHTRSDRHSLEYASLCTYKELIMDWQYELNKQRDGTDDIIYVENGLDMTPPPSDFNYVCSNVYAEGVPNPSHPDLSSSLCGCECYYLGRKCGPKSEFCCAHMAGSRFAYTPAGKVKVPPGTPIYECNTKCSCPSDCSNRIVQLGRKIPLCIFRTEGRGWGVKTTEPIKPNTFVTEYVGEVITNEEAEKRGKKCDARGITYLFDLDFEDDNSAFTIDAAIYGNISHFFNHSVSPWMHACSRFLIIVWEICPCTRDPFVIAMLLQFKGGGERIAQGGKCLLSFPPLNTVLTDTGE